MFYIICASVIETTPDGWVSTRALPTFFLSDVTQGITSEDHAQRIALDMLHTVNPRADYAVAVSSLDLVPIPF